MTGISAIFYDVVRLRLVANDFNLIYIMMKRSTKQMKNAKTKRISALVSLLLVVTVLFSGSVFASGAKLIPVGNVGGFTEKGSIDEESIAPRFTRNAVIIQNIRAYPVGMIDGQLCDFGTDYYESSGYRNSSYERLVISAENRAFYKNAFIANKGEQVGWRIEIDFYVDADRPLMVKSSIGGVKQSNLNVTTGMLYTLNHLSLDSPDSIPSWDGELTFVNSLGAIATTGFFAFFTLK